MPHPRPLATLAAGAAAALFTAVVAAQSPGPAANAGLTAIPGIKVGHHTMEGRPTGCTVILTEAGVMASVDVRGGAPGSRETALLEPNTHLQVVHAIVLSGGSAFGLDAATGVVRYLDERNIGYDTRVAKVPIVPAAILFDLGFGGDAKIRPNADCGYQAAGRATAGPVAEGNVGAGTGATVGKLRGPNRSMKAGVGTSAIRLPNGLIVAALVAVNAVGDVIDPATGQVIAGVRTADGARLNDARTLLRSGELLGQTGRVAENTTIGVVATNARLSKVDAQKMAQMAHDGFARAISPVHTPNDGDLIFSLATGDWTGEANLAMVGALAAEAMADAIVRAATQAESLAGVPSARELKTLPARVR